MKKASIPAVLAMVLASAGSAWAQPDRGRVQIQNGTVVTDDGMPLRGNAYEGGGPSEYQVGRDQYHFNCMRLCSGTAAQGGQDYISYTDSMVNLASQYGFYIIIDYHSEQIPDQNDFMTFWQAIAPRYASRTHVLYEMANEYGPGWWASSYGPSDIQWQQNAYQLIRSLAPNTHIITNSFANSDGSPTMLDVVQQQASGSNPIDYSNASVGFHPYGFDPNAILALKAQYPVISTEGPWPPGSRLAWLEANGISWQIMDGPTDIVSQIASGNWAVIWPLDPNTSDGTGPNNAPPAPPPVPVPPPSTPPPTPAPPPPSSFTPQPGAFYTLTNKNSGLNLDVQYAGTATGTPVWQYTPNGSGAQIWQFGQYSDGNYYLLNPNSNLFLGVTGDGTAAGSTLEVSLPDGSGAHAWTIGSWGNGTYYLQNVLSGLYLGVENDSTSVGGPAVISSPDGSGAHAWTIVDPPGPIAASLSSSGTAASGSSVGSSGNHAACGLTGLETVLVLGLLALRRRT